MALNGPPRYELYGLAGRNPYSPRPLDPIAHPGDRTLMLDLDGFLKTEPLYAYLLDAATAGRPAFVVVSGRNYTGRTSVANCILDLYRELLKVDDRFLVTRTEVAHHRDFEWLQQAIVQLQTEAGMAELKLTSQLVSDLDRIEDIKETIYQQRFQAIARRLSAELAGQGGGYSFGLVFEGLRTTTLISAAQTVFRDTRSITVFTHPDYRHAQTPAASLLSPGLMPDNLYIVRLMPLNPGQIRMLAEGRWKQSSALHCPFDPAGLDQMFHDAPVPIKAALIKLAQLLDYRLSIATGDLPWPENKELGMSRQWLVETVAAMDGWWR
jgi:hypothetical protein